jgi:putative DNA methylase
MIYKKKLIEVALPLEAINVASAREKSIRHGHPSTMHLWWARRPLAAARAVIFAQMVDDPSAYVDVLRSDPKLKRKAESVLKSRLKVWEELQLLSEKSRDTGSLILEPGPAPTLDTTLADLERERLFQIIKDLVVWENTTNEMVLQAARDEIWQSWRRACASNADHIDAKEIFQRNVLPAFHDPFAGGGALPIEAQRLGLESHASDLNPVAVLINKAMIGLVPKFIGKYPVNPEWHDKHSDEQVMTTAWDGAQGFADDVRYYGKWIRDEADKRIGHMFPKIEIRADMVTERPDLTKYEGQKLTVMAWIWARTVKSPNPAFSNVLVPLASNFMLSNKVGKEAYVEPKVEGTSYRFEVKVGKPKNLESTKLGTSSGKRAAFKCLMSEVPISYDYIREEGKSGRIGSKLMAIVAEGDGGRVYLSPTPEMEEQAHSAKPNWRPDIMLPVNPRDFKTPNYGLTTFADLFTSRQLVVLITFSDLVADVRKIAKEDAIKCGLIDDGQPLALNGSGATAYAEAIAVYLAFAINKLSDRGSTICGWDSSRDSLRNTFGRQAIPMTWDYAEANPFSESSGSYENAVNQIVKVIVQYLPTKAIGYATQEDASMQSVSANKVISTDPPYYDNIGYADLSDFFYIWLRRALKTVYPDLFLTLAVPKMEELVATPYRHGSKEKAETFFLNGMTHAMSRLAEQSHPDFPVTIYYAFKQAESNGTDGTINTGWDTFLAAVIEAGFAISGTWPMRTELGNRMIGSGANALASSIVLVCRKRSLTAPTSTRREFVSALKSELPLALALLQAGNIAPVDLAQAAIGPGMAVYTRYSKVLDAEGQPLSVRTALAIINQTLDEALAEQEGDFDADTRWALTWFEQVGFAEGEFGLATLLAQAKATGMDGLVEAGIISSGKGKVRLLQPSELNLDWNPADVRRSTIWEIVHQLIRALESSGEGAAANLLAKIGAKGETARELCYRLYTLCERKKRANEAMAYNGLVQSWPEITRLATEKPITAARGNIDMFQQE